MDKVDEELDRNLFEDEIALLENQIKQLDDIEELIVFYGSSSIRLWSTIKEDLKPLNVLNLGFGGSSYGWCVYYYPRLIKLLPKVSHFVFYGGDNDLDNGLSPERVAQKFQKLLDMTRADFPGVPISAISIKPSPVRTHLQDQIRLTNSLIRKRLSVIPRGYQINVFDSMLDEKGEARPELYVEDQLHLNEKGYKIWKGVTRKHFGI